MKAHLASQAPTMRLVEDDTVAAAGVIVADTQALVALEALAADMVHPTTDNTALVASVVAAAGAHGVVAVA